MGWILHVFLHSETAMLSRYAPDLQHDRFYRWLAVWHWLPLTLTGAALFCGGTALGGWTLGISWGLWGGFLRIAIGVHVPWLVNSATPIVGTSPLRTRHYPANN